MVRDLIGTVEGNTDMGILITRVDPSKGMLKKAAAAGTYTWSLNQQQFPKIQIITVEELLAGTRPEMPAEQGTLSKAPKHLRSEETGDQLRLD